MKVLVVYWNNKYKEKMFGWFMTFTHFYEFRVVDWIDKY